ncbi:hypothetical protein Goklo_007937 [Gossypium klotzschianum]|uniref:Uncharacterized protein n=1 Tax=Gossypium klotzschianum TaxID=34286 RepID=A0A7J8UY79_9ROSI|nr:hypothetical protein [Gossypium klotzschianum]
MWKWTKDSLLLSKSGPRIIPASKQELELAYLMNGVLLEEQDLLLDKKFLHLFPLEKALKYKLHGCQLHKLLAAYLPWEPQQFFHSILLWFLLRNLN